MTSTEPRPGRLQYQRQRDIYGLALKQGSVDVSELAKQFHVTTETIRRDLTELQERLLLRRVHGGAVPYERRDHEPMVDARGMLNAEAKLRIGREATLQVPARGSVIIDSVREHQALRRGGDWVEMTLDTQVADALPSGEAEILHVHEALLALEAAEPRLAKVVEMRYFGGYSETEIADALQVTERTVRRDWDKARLLLMSSLKD